MKGMYFSGITNEFVPWLEKVEWQIQKETWLSLTKLKK